MTNFFELYYKDLLAYAEKVVKQKDLMADPAELVNNAYLKFFDSGEDFDLVTVRKYIYHFHFEEITLKLRERAVGWRVSPSGNSVYSKKQVRITGDFVCTVCKEVKPANAFYLQRFKGFNYLLKQCKKCNIKRNVEWFRKNKDRWNEYMRKRRPAKGRPAAKPIHDLWKKANKIYIEKQKEMLTDVYVKSLLVHKIKNPTKEQIEEKRQELFAKRRMKKPL